MGKFRGTEQRPITQSNVMIVSADLGSCFGHELLPDVLEPPREFLQGKVAAGVLRGAWVNVFGGDLHLHLTTYNGDFVEGETYRENPSEVAARLALEAVLLAVKKGMEIGLYQPAEGANVLDMAPEEQVQVLKLRYLDFPFTERGAEPIYVAKALNASWGFFNRALFNLFFNPDKGSGRRIEGNDFLAVVESIEDLKAGKSEVRTYEFGSGHINELQALIADADEWRLSEVYATRGRFGEGSLREEPAAMVAGSFNPVLIGRSQSGLPAIGEFTQATGEFYFGPGGEGGGYRVGLMPVTFAEAQSMVVSEGTAKVVAYAYQSYDKGRIPEGPDVQDIFAQNRPETRQLQREAAYLIQHMVMHGEFEPYLNAQTAESRALEEAKRLGSRLQEIPDGEDPVVTAANQRAIFTISDIKADAGGKIGHTTPPNHFRYVADASLEEAKRAGLIFGTSEIIEVGDDGHLLMTHNKGADNNAIHFFAYKTFFRQVWVAEVLGYKWYGLGQDLVGDASAGKTTEELADLTDTFISLLPQFLPEAEKRQYDKLKASYERWKSGAGKGHTPQAPFSGNVSGQGPGFAELPMPRSTNVGLLAIDKAGPSAFNVPVYYCLQKAMRDGSLARYLAGTDAQGFVIEIWEVEEHRRIFLDLASELPSVERLLGATEKFNVKRVWTRTTAEWDPARAEESLGDILLSASTEKLAVITGGEYRGKDDPVLLA
ncbi:MAG: fructose 1,6-bisphosphatase, partial [Nitrospinota bacterium]